MHVHLEVNVEADWRPLDLANPRRMHGGRERLAIELAVRLAARGHRVSFRGGGCTGGIPGVEAGLQAPAQCDVCICVDMPTPADVEARRVVVWSHAAQRPADVKVWDAIVAVSPYHATLLSRRLGHPRIVAIPAGTTVRPDGPRRDRFLYASSPDRGLHRLLQMWPTLWRAFQTPLSITYDLRGVMARHGRSPGPLGARLRALRPLLDQEGVIVHGPLSPEELVTLTRRGRALLYPLDPVLPHSELYALSVLDAIGAGCPAVLAPVDALPSVYGEVARMVGPRAPDYTPEAWAAAVSEVVDNSPAYAEAGRAFAAARSWGGFVNGWEELLHDLARSTTRPPSPTGQTWLISEASEDTREAPYARLLADAAVKRGHRVQLLSRFGDHRASIEASWTLTVDATPASLIAAAVAGVDRIVLVSANQHRDVLPLLENLPGLPPVIGVETGWMKELHTSPGTNCLSALYIPLPPDLWDHDLQPKGGPYALPASLAPRTHAVGWLMPSPSAGLAPHPKRILLYLGAWPAPWLYSLDTALSEALDAVHRIHGMEVLYVAPEEGLNLPSWVERTGRVSAQTFANLVGTAALVLCHVDLVTLSTAQSAGVPVLVLAPGDTFGLEPDCDEDRIAHALFTTGEIEVSYGTPPAHILLPRILAALAAPRSSSAPGRGAEHLVDLIERQTPMERTRSWRAPVLVP